MEISNLLKIQKENDEKLKIDQSLTDYKILARKYLHLHISISELANETQCYKYWTNDGDYTPDKDTIFIKYIACLKKILSLSFDHNDNNTVEEVMMQPSEYCLSDQFLNLYIDINDLFVSPSKDHFLTLMEDFLSLGISLGYSESTIIDGFYNYDNMKVGAVS